MNSKRMAWFFLSAWLITALLLAGCGRVRIGGDLTPEERWAMAKSTFERGDYLDAIDVLTNFTLNYSGHALIDSAQFYLGESHMALHEYILAASEYQRLLQNRPTSPLGAEARLKIVLCYLYMSPKYSLDQYFTERTLRAVQDFLDDYPSTDATLNLATKKTGWEALRQALTLGIWAPRKRSVDEVLISETKVVFPQHSLGFGKWLGRVFTLGLYKPRLAPLKIPAHEATLGDNIAQRTLAECRSRLAQKEYKSGELYYRLQKYPSAVIYFDAVLELYPETPWSQDAARLKGDALFAMHKWNEAAQAYERYLRQENPTQRSKVQSRLEACRRYLQQSAVTE